MIGGGGHNGWEPVHCNRDLLKWNHSGGVAHAPGASLVPPPMSIQAFLEKEVTMMLNRHNL